MSTGKTNAKHIRVTIDDATAARDISTAVSNISGVGLSYAETDVTGYSDGVVNFTMGHPSSTIEITGPFTNLASTGAHTVFAAINGKEDSTYTCTVTVQIGIRADPTTGDPEFEGEYKCASYMLNGDGTYTARMVPGSATVPAWGTM